MLFRRIGSVLLRLRGSHFQNDHLLVRRFAVGNDNSITRQAIEDLVKEKRLFYVQMPEVLDDKEGSVKKWHRKEGEPFSAGDTLCEIHFQSIDIAFAPDHAGVLAEVLVNDGQFVPIQTPIAAYADSNDAYLQYVDLKRERQQEVSMLEAAKSVFQEQESSSKSITPMIMMRQIKHLIQHGKIEQESDFAKTLQSLARRGDARLMEVFEASFDGDTFNAESFDDGFFLGNAKGVIDNHKA